MVTFRNILKEREDQGEIRYHSVLEEMKREAMASWLNTIGEKFDSYNGLPHIQGVEGHLDHAVPVSVKREFSGTEIFILLAALLLHDIGKLDDDPMNQVTTSIKPSPTNNKKFLLPHYKQHSIYSCMRIQKYWPQLKIPNAELAGWIAILACSHTWDTLDEREKCNFKKTCQMACNLSHRIMSSSSFSASQSTEQIRLEWLAALLRLTDEVDNLLLIKPRAMPVRSDKVLPFRREIK